MRSLRSVRGRCLGGGGSGSDIVSGGAGGDSASGVVLLELGHGRRKRGLSVVTRKHRAQAGCCLIYICEGQAVPKFERVSRLYVDSVIPLTPASESTSLNLAPPAVI